ncbi:MAG: type II toxin-antitoxin system VapC family toxin [candidate division KSB1 bacterium]|nr:type II toxin-antitoxin system VapC family toxin [candidate division KSB1 bacterium]
MKQALIDTDTLSYFLRNQKNTVKSFKKYLIKYEKISISIITYYEILSGLKYKDSRKQLESFLRFSRYNSILPLTQNSIEISANIYSNLRKKGILIDDIDILIAGIALNNDLILVTHNIGHFERIQDLEIEDWY